MATVNDWDDAATLRWIRTRLVGRAQKAYSCFPDSARVSFSKAKDALKQRFEPASRQHLFANEFQARRKRRNEGWADFGEDLRLLADKRFRTWTTLLENG